MVSEQDIEKFIQQTKADRLPYAVCCINVEIISQVTRVSAAMGAERMIIFGWQRHDSFNVESYQYYIPVEHVYNEIHQIVSKDVFEKTLLDFGYFPVFIEQGGKDISQISEIVNVARDINLKPCAVIGCSGRGKHWPSTGIPSEFMSNSEYIYEIPQLGAGKSLAAVQATGISLWEIKKVLQA